MNKIIQKLKQSPPPAQPGEVNYHWVDRFTLAHLSIGIGYGLMGLKFWIVLVLAIGWELIENPLKANCPTLFPHTSKDTLKNAIGDCIAVVFGWGVVLFLFT